VDVFDDPHLMEFYDKAHSSLDEDRYTTPKEKEKYNAHYKEETREN